MITFTRCRRDWPRRYRTYHQETEPPFRHAEDVTVLRVGIWGLVWGRWTSTADDENEALLAALGAREADLLDDDGQLLPNYYKDKGDTP